MTAPEPFRCAVLAYGFMLDAGASTTVAQAAAGYGFANPAAGKSVDDLPRDVPLFIARAGQDHPALNATIDAFTAAALARNLPITVVNLPAAPHTFDLLDDSEPSRATVHAMVAFLRRHLGVAA
jgi:dienelactone hydrolase